MGRYGFGFIDVGVFVIWKRMGFFFKFNVVL